MNQEIKPSAPPGNSPLDLEQQLELARQLFQMEMHRAGRQALEQVKASSLVALAETLLTGVGCLARIDRRLAYIQLHLSALQRQLQSLALLNRESATEAQQPADNPPRQASKASGNFEA